MQFKLLIFGKLNVRFLFLSFIFYFVTTIVLNKCFQTENPRKLFKSFFNNYFQILRICFIQKIYKQLVSHVLVGCNIEFKFNLMSQMTKLRYFCRSLYVQPPAMWNHFEKRQLSLVSNFSNFN